MTVALIGVDATLADSIYEQVVRLGVLGATAIAAVLGIVAGRLAKAERRDLTYLQMKILVVVAHPDDVDFGAGGTVATWVAEGNEVVY